MGTRKFCDQCGNTTSQLSVYSYGLRYKENHHGNLASAAQVAIAGGMGVSGPHNPSQGSALENVELCGKCGSTWLDRVRKLTRQSDPDV